MTLAFFGEPRVPRLSKLLMEVKRGEISIPRFQRPFVWTDEQRIQLMESIYSGFPIGSLLVWRTQTHKLATYDHLGPLRMPAPPTGETTRQYLLDGHQRLVTLFAALGPGLYSSEGQALEWALAGTRKKRPWPLYFDLKEGDFRQQLPGWEAPPSHWLPMDKLFDSFALVDIKEQLKEEGFDRATINRVDALAETFRDYVVPILPIATEDIGQATVSFTRVNRGGTPVSEVHMVNALVFDSFDLMKEIEAIQDELKAIGWATIEPQFVLDVCKSRAGLPPYSESPRLIARMLMGTNEENQQKNQKWNRELLAGAKVDILKLASVLDQIAGVRSPKSLPYGHQATLLADALRDIDPSAEVVKRLRLWFWSTTLTEHFRAISDASLSVARLHLQKLVREEEALSWRPPGMSGSVNKLSWFDFDDAKLRAFGLLLAELGPKDPRPRLEGEADDPFDLLAEFGLSALGKLLGPEEAGGDYTAPTNRFLAHWKRSERIKTALREDSNINEAVLASHAIDAEAFVALRQQDWAQFLALRGKTIEKLWAERAVECGLTYQSSDEP